jgi:hypothetical protein
MKQLYLKATTLFITSSLTVVFVFAISTSAAQQVSGIITDYNSYWKSSVSSVSPVKPDNSHNLLAFTHNGVQYSTGVDDQALTSHAENFVAGDFWALPVEGFTGTITGNTKVGWGELKDGVHNGIGNSQRPQMIIPQHLTDGTKGLDLGTGIANLPHGNLTFFVSNIKPANIGDGIPDILVTQIADPGGATDRYSLIDAAGNTVGTRMNIAFNNIIPVANWTADFYEPASGVLTTLAPGYTNTDRPLRLWAADLSELGITAANYQSVVKFKVELSGTSDMAFAAYNNRTMSLTSVLPVKLVDFSGKKVNTSIVLNWVTASEENSDLFTIERSADNNLFQPIGAVNANGNSAIKANYAFTDKKPLAGSNYYRLKMVDKDATVTYSAVIKMQANSTSNTAYLYPNPCANNLTIAHSSASGAVLTIYSTTGIAVKKLNVSNSIQTSINVQNLEKGIYYAVWQGNTEKISLSFVKN